MWCLGIACRSAKSISNSKAACSLLRTVLASRIGTACSNSLLYINFCTVGMLTPALATSPIRYLITSSVLVSSVIVGATNLATLLSLSTRVAAGLASAPTISIDHIFKGSGMFLKLCSPRSTNFASGILPATA